MSLFLTGPQRSGTTLLDRLLTALPRVAVLSQPAPLVFIEAKREFLRSLGLDAPYPLGPLFPPEPYRPEAFAAFVRTFAPSRDWWHATLAAMADYSGHYTKFDPSPVIDLTAGRPLIEALGPLLGHLTAEPIAGLKETFCEEFVPSFLQSGWRTMVVLRDPRDIIASLNAAGGRPYGGRVKPTLFNVRQWRKAVAIATAFADAGCIIVRYEDLVAQPLQVLSDVASRLGLEATEAEIVEAIAGVTATWTGNSSFGRRSEISTDSVGSSSRLPPAVCRYVEAACLPELRLCGYEVQLTLDAAFDVIAEFQDPYPAERPDLADYGLGAATVELDRLRGLTGATDVSDDLYIYPVVRARLMRSLE